MFDILLPSFFDAKNVYSTKTYFCLCLKCVVAIFSYERERYTHGSNDEINQIRCHISAVM